MAKLALDLGTTTGFAWSGARHAIVSGTWDFRPKKFESPGVRYARFKDALTKLHISVPIEIVYFEAVRRHLGTDAAHIYGGLMSHLQVWSDENNIPYEGIPVGTIKKFWTGKGNAPKEAMIAEALRRGHEVVDDNEADALALLYLKAPEVDPEREPVATLAEAAE